MTASVVRNRAAIEAAFCSAERVTLAASMMPALTRSSYSPVAALRPSDAFLSERTFSTTTPPSRPAFSAICLIGPSRARQHDAGTGGLFGVFHLLEQRLDALLGTQQGDATTGDDTLFDGRLGGGHGVFDAVLLLLELHLGGRADLEHRDTTGELGQALLQLLLVVVGVGVLDLGLDLRDPAVDVVLRRRRPR